MHIFTGCFSWARSSRGFNDTPVITENARFLGPVGRGVLSARRVTESNNPIVWDVEAAALGLNITGNVTTAKTLRLTSAVAAWGALALIPDPLLATAALALTNGLLEE